MHVKGVTGTTNPILLGWLKAQLTQILQTLPEPSPGTAYPERLIWEQWQESLTRRVGLPLQVSPLRLLLVMDNLTGHKNPDGLCWCFAQGILPLYTPLGGSWLNRAESIQRLLKRRALEGQECLSPQPMIQALEAVAAHWNARPTPFVWAGKRRARRTRTARSMHRLGASGAASPRSVRAFYARLRPK